MSESVVPYRQYYHPKEQVDKDSNRARRRIAAFLKAELSTDEGHALARLCGLEFGRRPGATSSWTYDWETFVCELALLDFLDLPVLVVKATGFDPSTHSGFFPHKAKVFTQFVATVFRTEGMAYQIDEFGQIRNLVDQEFSTATESAVKILDRPEYVTARDHFQVALRAFADPAGDDRTTVREAFDAVECVFKQVFSVDRLNAAKIRESKPRIVNLGKDDSHSRFLDKNIEAFKCWVDGAHNYRHSNPESIRAPEPGDVVYFVSQAAAYLRWLVDLADRLAEPE